MISSADILNGKILIVDDQEANISLLERMLASAGYTSVASTTDPLEVCELHRKNHYDLILLDLEMPGMDGFQVMEGLKEIEPQDMLLELSMKQQFQVQEGLKEIEQGGYLPVIVITAHPDHKLRALRIGARDFISKPFELAEVLARVRNMLEVRLLHLESKSYINALELKIQEIEVSRSLIRRKSDEVKSLYDKLMSMEGGDAAAAELAKLHVATATTPHTLLYVEDNPANIGLIEQIIARRTDFRLLTAATGNTGINIARLSKPEVILLDINLPDFNGFEILKILLSDPSTAQIPVIALSANAMPRDVEKGMKAGFFRYLTKPIKIDEFLEALDVALEFPEKRRLMTNNNVGSSHDKFI